MAIKQSVDGQGRAILTILPFVDSLAALSFRQPSFRPSFSSCLPHAHRLLRAHRPAPSISSFQPFSCPSPDRASLLFVLPRQPPASLAPRILRRPRPPSIGFHHSPRSCLALPAAPPVLGGSLHAPLSQVPSAHSYLGSLHGPCLGLLRRRPLAVFSPRRSDSLSPGPALSLGCPSARRAAVAPPPCPSQPREVGSGKQEIRDGAFLPLPAPCFSAPYFSAPRFPLSASHFLLPTFCFPLSASHFLLPAFSFPLSASRFPLPASRFPSLFHVKHPSPRLWRRTATINP